MPWKVGGRQPLSSDSIIKGLKRVVAHACNPSYSGGRDQEAEVVKDLRPAPGQKIEDLSKK
jgi:hypothetical protein